MHNYLNLFSSMMRKMKSESVKNSKTSCLNFKEKWVSRISKYPLLVVKNSTCANYTKLSSSEEAVSEFLTINYGKR